MASLQHQEMPNQAHVALLAFPFGTHALPLFNLATKLAASLPAIVFSFFTTASSKTSLSAFISTAALPNLSVYSVGNGLPENYKPTGKRQEDIEYFFRATPGNFVEAFDAMAADGLPKIGLILSDSFLCCSPALAAEMGVAWISLWTSSATSLTAHLYTQQIRDHLGFRDDGDSVSSAILCRQNEFLDFIPALSYLKIGDLPEGIVRGPTKSLFSGILKEMAELSPKAHAVIFNTFEELDPTILGDLRTHFQKCLPIGPMITAPPMALDSDQETILRWLDRQGPATVVYVSFGTVATLSESELVELAEGLATAGKPFLWSMKVKQQESLPSGFLDRSKDRGLVVSWAPQAQVLGHVAVGAFVTHCGWNSVLESIVSGVPMLCRPFFGDQQINGRLVSRVWKIGIQVETGMLTRAGVEKSLGLLLGGDEGKVMRENVEGLKARANSAIQPGGSSFENFNAFAKMITTLCKPTGK